MPTGDVLWSCNYSMGGKAGGKKAKGDEKVSLKKSQIRGKILYDEKIQEKPGRNIESS